jgi:S1-C subfamily serine protease
MLTLGRPNLPPRPWLGLFVMENENGLVVGGMADGGPADRAGVQAGDRVLGIGDEEISDLATLWRRVWASGAAGAPVNLRLSRDEGTLAVRVVSADRTRFLRSPRLH